MHLIKNILGGLIGLIIDAILFSIIYFYEKIAKNGSELLVLTLILLIGNVVLFKLYNFSVVLYVLDILVTVMVISEICFYFNKKRIVELQSENEHLKECLKCSDIELNETNEKNRKLWDLYRKKIKNESDTKTVIANEKKYHCCLCGSDENLLSFKTFGGKKMGSGMIHIDGVHIQICQDCIDEFDVCPNCGKKILPNLGCFKDSDIKIEILDFCTCDENE